MSRGLGDVYKRQVLFRETRRRGSKPGLIPTPRHGWRHSGRHNMVGYREGVLLSGIPRYWERWYRAQGSLPHLHNQELSICKHQVPRLRNPAGKHVISEKGLLSSPQPHP